MSLTVVKTWWTMVTTRRQEEGRCLEGCADHYKQDSGRGDVELTCVQLQSEPGCHFQEFWKSRKKGLCKKNFSELKSESLMGCPYLVAESGSVRLESKAEIKETCLLLR